MKYFLLILLVFSFQSFACMPSINIGEIIIEVPDPIFEKGTVDTASVGKVKAKIFFDDNGKVLKLEKLKLVPASLPLLPIKEALYSAKRHFSSERASSHDIDIEFKIKFKQKIMLKLNFPPPKIDGLKYNKPLN